jgi:ATP-dependent Clp protease ATP-binding subunit ClpA
VFERFTDRARRVVVLAQEEARMLSHNYIGTEHLLLGLAREERGVAAKTLESLGISLQAIRSQVEGIIGRGQSMPSGHIPFTPRAKKVLELSLREARALHHDYIGTEHILLGLIREGQGVAAQVLVKLGAELDRVRRQVIQLLQGYAGAEAGPSEPPLADAKELVRKAVDRARRARELAEYLAAAIDDPAITASDVFDGFLVMEERLLALEVVAKRMEEGERPEEDGGKEATSEEN